MRFMPMGRPIRPRPMSPIFLGAAADSKECLLESDVREARRCCQRKEETIVAELRGGSSEEGESTTNWIRRRKARRSGAGGKILQGGQPFIEFPAKQFEIDGFFFFLMIPRPPRSTLFPYTTRSDSKSS